MTQQRYMMCVPWGRHVGLAFKRTCSRCPNELAMSVPAKLYRDEHPETEMLCGPCVKTLEANVLLRHEPHLNPPWSTSGIQQCHGMPVAETYYPDECVPHND